MAQRFDDAARHVVGAPRLDPWHTFFKFLDDLIGDPLVEVFAHLPASLLLAAAAAATLALAESGVCKPQAPSQGPGTQENGRRRATASHLRRPNIFSALWVEGACAALRGSAPKRPARVCAHNVREGLLPARAEPVTPSPVTCDALRLNASE